MVLWKCAKLHTFARFAQISKTNLPTGRACRVFENFENYCLEPRARLLIAGQ